MRRERRRHVDRVEAVLDQLELTDHLGPDQAQRVRERREAEARVELFGDRRATDEVPLLEDQRLQSGLGEVGAVDEAVVATADDDRVVAVGLGHDIDVFRSGLKNGIFVTLAGHVV